MARDDFGLWTLFIIVLLNGLCAYMTIFLNSARRVSYENLSGSDRGDIESQCLSRATHHY